MMPQSQNETIRRNTPMKRGLKVNGMKVLILLVYAYPDEKGIESKSFTTVPSFLSLSTPMKRGLKGMYYRKRKKQL